MFAGSRSKPSSRGWFACLSCGLSWVLWTSSVQAADVIEVGQFAATTGSAPYTQIVSHGLGETPKAILIWTVGAPATVFNDDIRFSVGVADGTNEYCVGVASDHGVGTSENRTRVSQKLIVILDEDSTSLQGEAELQSWDTSGFTLNWTTAATDTYLVHYMILGGSGISADVTAWDSPTSTGNHSVTGIGFEPDAVIHIWSATATSFDTNVGDLDMGIGVMEASGDQWAMSIYSEDNLGTSNTASGQQTDACIHDPDDAVPLREASYVSMDTGGFTVNFGTVDGANKNISLSLRGVTAEAASFSKSTSGAPVSQSINGHAFAPSAVFFASFQQASSAGGVADAKIGLGGGDGTSEVSVALLDESGVGTTNGNRVISNTKAFTVYDGTTQSVDAEADLTSLDDDGYTLNWTTNSGVATQICSLALAPFSAISARIEKVRAVATADGVHVTWWAAEEIGNVGFHVYREQAGAQVRVTSQPIPGSALGATSGTAMQAGGHYRFHDPDGRARDRYWVQDLGLDGSRARHGPFLAISGTAPISAANLQAVTTPATSAGASASIARTRLRSFDASYSRDPVREGSLASAPALVIGVSKEAVYRVRYEDWVDAGLSSEVDPQRFRLYFRGEEHPIVLAGAADGSFDPGDSLVFYGRGSADGRDAHCYYWLTEGQPGARRIGLNPVPLAPSTNVPTSYVSEWTYRRPLHYFPTLRNGEKSNYFGELLTDSPLNLSLKLPGYAVGSAEPIEVAVALQGIGAGQHEVRLVVDGSPEKVVTFHGMENATAKLQLRASSGSLRVELATSSRHDFAFLESLSVRAPRRYVSSEGVWFCSSPGGSTLLLQEASPTTRVLDITDPLAVSELSAPLLPWIGGGLRWTRPEGAGDRQLVVFSETRAPASLRRNQPSEWRKSVAEAEFVIVSPREFHRALAPLVAAREADGLGTVVVAFEDLCDEYAGGSRTPHAIAEFLVDAYRRWPTLPRYLLLVGDDTSDPLGHLAPVSAPLLPSMIEGSARLETVSDSRFGDVDGDGRLEIAVGRFPAADVSEVELMVARTLQYGKQSGAQLEYRQQGVVVSDSDGGISFAGASERLMRAVSELRWWALDLNDQAPGEVTDLLTSALAGGVGLIAYFGHGGTQGWSAELVWNGERAWSASHRERWPIVAVSSCLNGYFQHATVKCLAESWLTAPRGGAVAVLASSDLANPHLQRKLTLAWLAEISSPVTPRLGDAFLSAQWATEIRTVATSLLFGDPTLRFQR